MPKHEIVRITGKFHIIDTWDLANNERVIVYVDGIPVYEKGYDHAGNTALAHICGNSGSGWGDSLNQ
jgi:hypothetical protein